MENITLTNPANPSETWTSGKRGRRPLWVTEILAKDPSLVPEKKEEAKVIIPTKTGVRYWKWVDQDNQPTRWCVVVANSEQEAVIFLNKTFKQPVFDSEWRLCWREIDHSVVPSLTEQVGVFGFNKTTNLWEQRKVIA
jgi:hypothetical protein